jgi:hypothetical protein
MQHGHILPVLQQVPHPARPRAREAASVIGVETAPQPFEVIRRRGPLMQTGQGLKVRVDLIAVVVPEHLLKSGLALQTLPPPCLYNVAADAFFKIRHPIGCSIAQGFNESLAAVHGFAIRYAFFNSDNYSAGSITNICLQPFHQG